MPERLEQSSDLASANAAASAVPARAGAPVAAARVVRCERLLGQLGGARHCRCIVVQGPAGSGKTTTLLMLRRELQPLGYETAWLALTPAANDVTQLLDDLLASLDTLNRDIGREAAQVAGRGTDPEAVECTVVALVRGVAAMAREVVLMVDDLHVVDDPAAIEALQMLLDYAPANLHVIFASRNAVPFSLARLRAQGAVLELDGGDLRLRAEESEQFLRTRIDDISHEDAMELHALTDGWMAGLQLLSVDWLKSRRRGPRKHASPGDFARARIRDDRAFSQFFEKEVLSRMDAGTLDIAVSAALCDRFCPPLCAAIIARPEAAARIAVTLAELEKENLFFVRVEGEGSETWYALHPLLRDTLRRRLAARTEPQLRAMHEAAWQWCAANGYLDEAVRQALLAGAADSAADLVERHAGALHAQGRHRQIIGLLQQLPSAQIEARIPLRLWQARMQLFARDLGACAQTIARLERDIPQDDVTSRAALVQLSGGLAIQRDDIDGAVALLPHAQHLMAGGDVFAEGSLTNLLSWIYMQQGDYEAARGVQADASRRGPDGGQLLGTAAGLLQGRCFIGLSYAVQGHMNLAEREFREVLFEAGRGGPGFAEPRYMATALLGEMLYETNDVQGARELLSPQVDVLERASIPDTVLRVMAVLSVSHWLAGQRLEALAYLERLEDYATRHGLDRLLAYSLSKQVQRYLEAGEFERADSALVRVEALSARHTPAHPRIVGWIEAMARRARVRWFLVHGDLEGAAVALHSLIALCESRRDMRFVAMLQTQAAVTDARRGRDDLAREKLLAALRIGHRLGLLRSLLDSDPGAPALIVRLARDVATEPVLGFYAERLVGALQGPDAPEPATDRPARGLPTQPTLLSDREFEVMRLVAQSVPSKKIARVLGVSYTTVKWHLKNIYGKLGVSSRDEAVARMREIRDRTRS